MRVGSTGAARRSIPQRGILVANTNQLPFLVRLIPRDQFVSERTAAEKNRLEGEFARQTGAPYAMFREPLLAPSGLPCNPPPWGSVVALDLSAGKIAWSTPLGSMEEKTPAGCH